MSPIQNIPHNATAMIIPMHIWENDISTRLHHPGEKSVARDASIEADAVIIHQKLKQWAVHGLNMSVQSKAAMTSVKMTLRIITKL